MVRDLVELIGMKIRNDIRVVVVESADPEYFIPHVDLTRVAEYTAEAAKACGKDDASLGMLLHKLSGIDQVTIAKIRGRASRWRQRTRPGLRHALRGTRKRHTGAT